MEQKRVLTRRHLIRSFEMYDKPTILSLGHLVDITTEGMMLLSENPLQTNTTYKLRMELPEEIDGCRHVDYHARAMWGEESVKEDFYNTGFKLQDVSPRTVKITEALIRKYGFPEERRRVPRSFLMQHLLVFDQKKFRRLGHLVDISTQGVMMMSETPIPVGTICHMRMNLPCRIEGSRHVEFHARAIWCGESVKLNFFSVGFELLNLSAKNVKTIESLVRQLGFYDLIKNQSVRYYRGIEKYNCAQAILKAFQNTCRLDGNCYDESTIDEFRAYGGGQAEDGICGALYAARRLTAGSDPAHHIDQRFIEATGSVFCDELLEMGRLSCVGCVYTADKILQDFFHLKRRRRLAA